MMLSKSFGYALRAVLYVALMSDEKKRIQVDEIAHNISVPKHFLGKIMNRLVKEGILISTKGPYGGYSINKETLNSPLSRLVRLTDGMDQFTNCLLRLDKCNPDHPCPLHQWVQPGRTQLLHALNETAIKDLIDPDKQKLANSIISGYIQT